MTAKSHLILSTLPVVVFFENNILHLNNINNIETPLIAIVATAFGALLPDIDEPHSYIGRKLSFISELLKALNLKHRTFTHSIFFSLIIAVLGYLINPVLYFVAFGSFMHLLEDMITNSGVSLFYPFYKKRIGIRLFDTATLAEYLFTTIIVIATICYSYYFIKI
jgi:inner membrane protein